MKSKVLWVCIFLALSTACAEKQDWGGPVEQMSIHRIDLMPDIPNTYQMINWKEKAHEFDRFVFDWNNKSQTGPLIWLDNARRNVDQTTFGLYTAINDIRQGPKANNGEFHESLNSLAAILGAGLVGIDKTDQDGYNYVKMVQNYFNSFDWYQPTIEPDDFQESMLNQYEIANRDLIVAYETEQGYR